MTDKTCRTCGGTGRFMIERLGGGCKVDGGPCYDCDGAGTRPDDTCKTCGGKGKVPDYYEEHGIRDYPCPDCQPATPDDCGVRVEGCEDITAGSLLLIDGPTSVCLRPHASHTLCAVEAFADAIRKLVREAENNAYVNGRQDEGEPCPYCNHRGADRANEHEVIKYGQSFSVDSLQTVWQCRSCKERWTTNEMEDVRQAFVDAAKVNYLRGLARAMEIAENEPELPGPIPEELRAYDTEHLCRSCVRTTKRNIADAIKAEMEKGNAES